MYIHPFVAGIIFTILVETALSVAIAIVLSRKPKDDKEKE